MEGRLFCDYAVAVSGTEGTYNHCQPLPVASHERAYGPRISMYHLQDRVRELLITLTSHLSGA